MSERSVVSIVLLAYNQERYVRDAVDGAFSQTYSPLEIVLSDDGSSDRTFDIILEMASAYRGPHKLIVNRNETNLGISGHFNRVMSLATGEIIALAAGDDISLRNRIADSVRLFSEYPDVTCVSLGLVTFHGDPPQDISHIPSHDRIRFIDLAEFLSSDGGVLFAPARAFRRSTHDYFGPITSSSPSEDTASLFRCLLLGRGVEVSNPGVLYRLHGTNTWSSNNKFKTSISGLQAELESTLRTAQSKGLVDAASSRSIQRKIRRRLGKLSVVLQLERSHYSFGAFVRHFLTSSDYTVLQKAARIWRSLCSRPMTWR